MPIKGIICVVKDNENAEMMLRLGTIDSARVVEALENRGLKVTYVS